MNREDLGQMLENVWNRWADCPREEVVGVGCRVLPLLALLFVPAWRGWFLPLVWYPWLLDGEESFPRVGSVVECLLLLRAMLLGLGDSSMIFLGTLLDTLWWIAALDRLRRVVEPGGWSFLTSWMDLTGIGGAFQELSALSPPPPLTRPAEAETEPNWKLVVGAHGHHFMKGAKLWVRRKMLMTLRPPSSLSSSSTTAWTDSVHLGWWMLLSMVWLPGMRRLVGAVQLSTVIVEYVRSLPCIPPVTVLTLRGRPGALSMLVGSVSCLDWKRMQSSEVRKTRGMQGPMMAPGTSAEHLRILEQSLQEVFRFSPPSSSLVPSTTSTRIEDDDSSGTTDKSS